VFLGLDERFYGGLGVVLDVGWGFVVSGYLFFILMFSLAFLRWVV
jgi:hypothetical protein